MQTQVWWPLEHSPTASQLGVVSTAFPSFPRPLSFGLADRVAALLPRRHLRTPVTLTGGIAPNADSAIESRRYANSSLEICAKYFRYQRYRACVGVGFRQVDTDLSCDPEGPVNRKDLCNRPLG